MDNKITLSCPCHFGLESVLNFEIKKIGGENITVTDGRISFEGGYDILARANICLATAERVQIPLTLSLRVLRLSLWKDLLAKATHFPSRVTA